MADKKLIKPSPNISFHSVAIQNGIWWRHCVSQNCHLVIFRIATRFLWCLLLLIGPEGLLSSRTQPFSYYTNMVQQIEFTIHANIQSLRNYFLPKVIDQKSSLTAWNNLKNTYWISPIFYVKLPKSMEMTWLDFQLSTDNRNRQGYILTNLINMSVKLFSTVSIVFFPVDFKSARYHSRFCIFN